MKFYKWINSTGGPIVIISADAIEKWSGCFSTESVQFQKIIDAEDFLNPNETDYGKACQVEKYIEVINFGDNKAIVLGGEPLQTTYLKSDEDVLLVRWIYAENYESVNHYLQSIKVESWSHNEVVHLSSENYVIFDSSEIGFNLKQKESLRFSLKAGNYQIKTCEYKPDSATFLLIHTFERIT
jgi:Immunity protein 21